MERKSKPQTEVRFIKLTQGQVAIVDADDYDLLNSRKWCTSKHRDLFYAHRKEGGRTIQMHRQILNAPKDLYCDHINHNGLDNRRANLRLCTPSQNCQNQLPQAGFSSIYKGVSRLGNRWRAVIKLDGRYISIGSFDNQLDAAIAYDEKAIELFGEFACLNFFFYPEIRTWLEQSYLFDPTRYQTACLCR